MRRRPLLAAALALGARPAAAWTAPGPIRVLVGFPPGGAADLVVRIAAEGLARTGGPQLIVDSRTGAYGFIAAGAASHAAPDGLTLASAIMGMMCVLPILPGVPIPLDVERDLTPVTNLAGTPMALVCRPDAPFATTAELVALARRAPGRLTYASAGNGSINHLAGLLFAREAGITMLHVPYRGGAPAGLDVAAGRVDLMVGNVAEFAPMIEAGQVRALGLTATRPSPLLPTVPLLTADYPEMEISNWFGLAGPPNLPPEIVSGLSALFADALRDPATVRTLAARGLDPLPIGGADFAAQIRRDRARWAAVVAAGGIRGD